MKKCNLDYGYSVVQRKPEETQRNANSLYIRMGRAMSERNFGGVGEHMIDRFGSAREAQ